jgi:acyl-CoA reductase-like NAD-dependent aldehyde dehydrogenase
MYLKSNHPAMAHAGKTIIGFNWIGGKELEGDLPSFDAKSPVDSRDTVGIFPECGERDLEKAAKAAAEAFKSWKEMPAPVRGAHIGRISTTLATNREKLARIITRETGKPLREALGEVQEAIDICDFYQSEGRRLHGQTVPSELPNRSLYTHRRPVGVCGLITPSIFPLAVPVMKILPAILCGNTVVWKPSSHTPSVAYLFGRAMMDAGLPAGVVNIVNGKGHGPFGKHFLAGIDKGLFQKFSFSGSTASGRHVGERCGKNLIPASLELGAKNPLVIMPDCDLDQALAGALFGAFGSAGQRCTSVANIIVHRDVMPAFREKFLEAVRHLAIGNPIMNPEVFYGPMIGSRLAHAFEEHWEMGRKDGAKLLTGGERWTADNRTERVLGEIAKGVYMQPCVWDEVTPGMHLFQHEILGPTVNLSTVDSFEQALEYANGTPYGLCSAIYTQDRHWIERFTRDIRAGMTSINNSTVGSEVHLPFGGTGWSGNGTREGGAWALDAYTRWQAVNDNTGPRLQLAQIETDYSKRSSYDVTKWDTL